MNKVNYTEIAINKNKDFCEDVKKATIKFFESDHLLFPLHKDEIREVKYIRLPENDYFYIFEKKGKVINVYWEMIHDFEKDKKDLDHLYYGIQCMKEKKDEIYSFEKVMTINLFEQEHSVEDILEQFNIMLTKFEEENNQEMIKKVKQVIEYTKTNSEDFLSNALLTSSSIDAILNYNKLLSKYVGMKEYSHDFYLSLADEPTKISAKYLSDWIVKKNYLKKMCDAHGFTKENRFEFNDLDNHVWIQDGNLFLDDQNCTFYFEGNDDNNFTVYFLHTEYSSVEDEMAKLNNHLNNKKDVFFEHTVLVVKDGKVIYASDSSLMYVFKLDIRYSVEAMRNKGLEEVKYDKDIYSYEYQRDYFYTQYGMNELSFLMHTFLTLGGGADYNSEKGCFEYSDIGYLETLRKEENSRINKKPSHKIVYQPEFISIEKVEKLNKDWFDAFKYFVKMFKENEYYSVFYEDKDKAISSRQLALDKLKMIENNIQMIG